MSKFEIIQANPRRFKTQILHFWEEYLPGTPPARFDWMENNPAGPAIWLFAIEERTGNLAGTLSLFPKRLFLDGKEIRAAILGDFMLCGKYRVFGPALDLLKAAITYCEEGRFDFLYTIPNRQSKKIAERVGFRSAGQLYSMVCPQQCDFLMEKYVSPLAVKILDKPLTLAFKLFSRATYATCPGVVEEIDWQDDDAFNGFSQQVDRGCAGVVAGEYSLPYLDWRYRQNPEFDFQVFTFRERTGGDVQGLFIFSIDKYRLELYDIVALDEKFLPAMVNKICKISKAARCRGVYCSVYEANPLLPLLKRCGFFDAKDQVEVYVYPEGIKEIDHWSFTSADRNI